MTTNWLRAFRDYRRLKALPEDARQIAFYSEGCHNWPHLGPIVRELAENRACALTYISSGLDDPGLEFEFANVHKFYLGDGAFRTAWFSTSRADLIVMTMPDLGNSYIRRSVNSSSYVYVHHSMVSTHMIYNDDAFDGFDTIFCVGPHHVAETREREAAAGLPAKRLVEHGYGRLDTMLAALAETKAVEEINEVARVVVAPSWGPSCILETCGVELIEALTNAGIHTTVRAHPMTISNNPGLPNDLRRHFGNDPNFVWETDMNSFESYRQCDVMVSDWSGAALEFAFAFEKPVLFVDVPPKIRNSEFDRYQSVPVEVSLRDRLGEVISADGLSSVSCAVNRLRQNRVRFRQGIIEARSATVFNSRSSASTGAGALLELLKDMCQQPGG